MFLAMTALSEFWDTRQPMLFLGSWCLRHDRRAQWESLRYEVLPSPWSDRRRYGEAAQEADATAERLLDALAGYLNEAHGLSHGRRYWRVLCGAWCAVFVHAVYDRYVHLREALRDRPDLETLALDPSSYRTPASFSELSRLLNDDAYNLQLYSELLHHMGYAFPLRSRPQPTVVAEAVPGVSAVRTLQRSIAAMLRKAQGRRYAAALCDLSAPTDVAWRLAWRLRFQAVPMDSEEVALPLMPAVFDARRNGLVQVRADNEFERLLVQLLPRHLPTAYLEGFSAARRAVLRRYPSLPPVVASSVGWYYNEPFKFFAAEAVQHGSRLIAIQHGGAYGMSRFCTHELHERRLSDCFIAWGWAGADDASARNLPVYHPIARRTGRDGAPLFILTEHPRYLHDFRSTPSGSLWTEYLAWQQRFIGTLPDALRRTFVVRAYPERFGHAIQEQLAERFPQLQWDEAPLLAARLRSCRLVVVDHLATTFLEALAADVPTVLFWDPNRWEARHSAQPALDVLRQAGILWDEPEAAARHIAAIAPDVEAWWRQPQVQSARAACLRRFLRTEADWTTAWAALLTEQAGLASSRPSGEALPDAVPAAAVHA